MKQLGILPVILALLISCQSGPDVAPDNSGAVVDTQATIAAGAASVTAGAGALETKAVDLADTLGTLAQVNPSLAPIAAQAASHAAAAKDHARAARKLEEDVAKARLEVVAGLARTARIEGLYQEERIGRVKAVGQRNTAWVALGALVTGITVGLVFAIARKTRLL